MLHAPLAHGVGPGVRRTSNISYGNLDCPLVLARCRFPASLPARGGKSYTITSWTDARVGLQDLATDAMMVPRLLRCAIEDVPDWHANLFLEPHLRFTGHPFEEAPHGQ